MSHSEASNPSTPEFLPVSVKRVVDFAQQVGLSFNLKIVEQTTHTVAQAAQACGCAPEEILKTLVFRGKNSHKPYLILASGTNRVNEKNVSKIVGEVIEKADTAFVEAVTGFTVGGVAPLAHDKKLPILMDETLLNFQQVWCAAGTDKAVIQVPVRALARAISARIIKVG